MRDLFLLAAVLVHLPLSLRFPAAGVMSWAWFSMMSPHRQVYGFALGAPLNSLIAAATIAGLIASPERKRLPADPVPYVMLLLLAWLTLNTSVALFPSYAWEFWDRVIRIFAMVFVAFLLLTNKTRIHAMAWTIVISLGFYGVKGGVFTITQAGHAIVYGPPETVYADNNHLALATVTLLPLVFYLMRYTRRAWLRLPMVGAIALLVLEVFGSYSRGGMIAMLTMFGMLWVRSSNKVLYAILAVSFIGIGASMMPPEFFDRMNTVKNADTDESFQGRVDAWHVAMMAASRYFPFGLGFNTAQIPEVFDSYLPGHHAHAAHSIYFQMLGDNGWVGLAIYVVLLIVAVLNASYVRKQCKGKPELRWAYDLADMCRISLISFYVGGIALSMDYADEYLMIMAMLSGLRRVTSPQAQAKLTKQHMAEPADHAAAPAIAARPPVYAARDGMPDNAARGGAGFGGAGLRGGALGRLTPNSPA